MLYYICIVVLFLGCEVVAGDMNDFNSLLKATKGAHGVFIVTTVSEDEMKQVHCCPKLSDQFRFKRVLGWCPEPHVKTGN